MAADYVMVQFATPRKPEVLRIATILNIKPVHAFGLCVVAWMWFDEQTINGHAFGVTFVTLDDVVCHTGFAKALSEVGWLEIGNEFLRVPNFDRLMGESSKKRAKAVLRKRKQRANHVTKKSQKPCDKSVTKEERRKKKVFNPQTPFSGGGISMKDTKPKPPNPVFIEEWFSKNANRLGFAQDDQGQLIHVLACAERAFEITASEGGDANKLFHHLVLCGSKGDWSKLSGEQIDRAKRRLRDHRNKLETQSQNLTDKSALKMALESFGANHDA